MEIAFEFVVVSLVSNMRNPIQSPSVVPSSTVHLVLDDFGPLGKVYRETDEGADADEVIQDMLAGQFNKPVRVVAFNTTEGWARDVSENIAWEVLKRVAFEGRTLADSTRSFCIFHVGENETQLAESAAL